MNTTGVAAAGGIGKYLSEWIVDGASSLNLWSFDVQRFADIHNNRKFLKDRVTESLSERLTWHSSVPIWLQNDRSLWSNVIFGVCVWTGIVSQIPYWEADMIGWDSGRRLRTSAIFTRNEPYAAFGQSMGYERPLYFHSFAQMEEDSDSVWTMPKPAASVHGIKACTYSLCCSLLIQVPVKESSISCA